MPSLLLSPLHPRTSALMQGQQWRRWAGHAVASAYEMTSDRETLAIRNACALIDISPLYKYEVRGPDALAFLDRLVTRDLSTMEPGQVRYTPWCDGRGKVVDDGTVTMLSPSHLRLTAAESNWRWLADNAAGFAVEITDASRDLAALSLQGPTSRAVLESASDASISALPYQRLGEIRLAGEPTAVTRTGYTGDLGYELWIPRARALAVWDALVHAGARHALQPAGMWALDVARIEAGLIMLDVDYTPAPRAFTADQASSPFELGLGWAVHLDKPRFVGKKALAEEKKRGPSLKLVGLQIDHVALGRAYEELGLPTPLPFVPWREVTPIFGDRAQVGYATSGTWSPVLKSYLALAQVASPWAVPGKVLHIEQMVDRRRRTFEATVSRLPFLDLPRKKA
ncbi:MAG: aminomethyltransferase family protein [Byssovorax sp.]